MKTRQKALRRSLMVSMLSLLLCVAMLVGTTFAWFTDSASTGVNAIQAGTLDVDLVDEKGASLVGKTLQFAKAAGGANEAVLWEPGCTYELPGVYVQNNGNLALKYKLIITGIDGDAKLNEAIEWTLNGEAIADAEHNLSAGASSDELVLSGHMKEEAGNEFQGLSIDGIAITVLATQYTEEYDSNDNQYDADAKYPVVVPADTTNLTNAINAVEENGTLTLSSSVVLDARNAAYIDYGKHMNFDLAGNTLSSQEKLPDNPTTVLGVYGNSNVAISNGAIQVPSDMWRAVTVAENGTHASITNMKLTGGNDGCVTVFEGASAVVDTTTVNTTTGGCLYANGGVLEVKGGTFTQNGNAASSWFESAVMASNMGTVNVSGGTYSSSTCGAYVFNSGGTINISGGTFTAPTALKADYGTGSSTINVSGGAFDGKITIAAQATLNIEGGSFTNTGMTLDQFKVYVADGHTVTETNGTYTVV